MATSSVCVGGGGGGVSSFAEGGGVVSGKTGNDGMTGSTSAGIAGGGGVDSTAATGVDSFEAATGAGTAATTGAGTAAGAMGGIGGAAARGGADGAFSDGSEGITNGSGAAGNVGAAFVVPPGATGGRLRGGRPGMEKPAGLKPGKPPAGPWKFMKLKSGMVGAGICMPGCAIAPPPVVVDIIKGIEKGTVLAVGRTGIVGAPDINGDGSTGALGS